MAANNHDEKKRFKKFNKSSSIYFEMKLNLGGFSFKMSDIEFNRFSNIWPFVAFLWFRSGILGIFVWWQVPIIFLELPQLRKCNKNVYFLRFYLEKGKFIYAEGVASIFTGCFYTIRLPPNDYTLFPWMIHPLKSIYDL